MARKSWWRLAGMRDGVEQRDFLPKRPFWTKHVDGAFSRSEKVRKLLSYVRLDRAILRRPDISAASEFESNDGMDVTYRSIEPWFEANGIREQKAQTIPIGNIWRYRPTRITKLRLETLLKRVEN
jgi:hypothetical protein